MDPKPSDATFAHTFEGSGPCPNCRHVLPRLLECAPAYFEKGYVICAQCGTNVELWQAALESATRLSLTGAWALASLGAAQTSVVMPLETGRHYSVELTDYGVPAGAKILKRNYTGQGGDVTAMEWHGNAPPLRFPGTVLHLVGVPLGEGSLPRVGQVSINVVWIRREDSDEWHYLVTAFDSAAAGDYAQCLVFAQSAVEISMMPLIERRFLLHAPKKVVSRFTSYYRALNVVLPYLCGESGAARMPDCLLDALNKLGKKRNDIIHEGPKVAAITPDEAMEGLCAAAFGFEYIRYAAQKIEGKDGGA